MIDNRYPVWISQVYVTEDRRPVDGEAVKKLAESMKDIGLQHPITRAREDER